MKELFHPALSRKTNIISKSVASKLFGPVRLTETEKVEGCEEPCQRWRQLKIGHWIDAQVGYDQAETGEAFLNEYFLRSDESPNGHFKAGGKIFWHNVAKWH